MIEESGKFVALEQCHILIFEKETLLELIRQEVELQPNLKKVQLFLKSLKMFEHLSQDELDLLTCNIIRKQVRRG